MPIASQRNGRDERAALLPPELVPLFDDGFVQSCDLLEEYVARLTLACFRSTGLEAALCAPATADEAVSRAGLAPDVARVPVAWILAVLATRGWLRSEPTAMRYVLSAPLPVLEAGALIELQERHDPRCLPSYRIAELAAACYPAVLKGEISGDQALFGAEGISAWVKYFSNDNPLYAISNQVGAIAAERALAPQGGDILELGGGLGSATIALLQRLQAMGRSDAVDQYRFTELSALFLKRAQRTLLARSAPVELVFAPLDIDRPFSEGGAHPGTCALVYGVNVMHVARDLRSTLSEVRRTLAPGAALVVAECVRPFAGAPLHLEFVFNLLGAFRDPVLAPPWRPNGGFLTPEQWIAALEANGFVDVSVFPDIAKLRDAYPGFVVAAITGKRA